MLCAATRILTISVCAVLMFGSAVSSCHWPGEYGPEECRPEEPSQEGGGQESSGGASGDGYLRGVSRPARSGDLLCTLHRVEQDAQDHSTTVSTQAGRRSRRAAGDQGGWHLEGGGARQGD